MGRLQPTRQSNAPSDVQPAGLAPAADADYSEDGGGHAVVGALVGATDNVVLDGQSRFISRATGWADLLVELTAPRARGT